MVSPSSDPINTSVVKFIPQSGWIFDLCWQTVVQSEVTVVWVISIAVVIVIVGI